MTRTEQILDAITEGLNAGPGDVRQFIIVTLAVATVIVIAAILQRRIARRREVAGLEKQFEREIRRLDLTVRQVDILNQLSAVLSDPAKRYLLLVNPNTFRHSARIVGDFHPPLDASFDALQKKLGFALPAQRQRPIDERAPAVGSAVKIAPIRTRGTVLAVVRERSGKNLRLELGEKLNLRPGTEVRLFAAHPSALLEASGTVLAREGNAVSIRVDRSFKEAAQRKLASNALNAFIHREGTEGESVPVTLISISPNGAIVRCEGMRLKKRDDIRLIFRRGQSQWTAINGEVSRVRRRGRKAWIRFSHLAHHARRTVLDEAVRAPGS